MTDGLGSNEKRKILTRREVKKAIKMQGPIRPPIVDGLTFPWQMRPAVHDVMERFPEDVISTSITVSYWDAPDDDPDFRFAMRGMTRPGKIVRANFPVISDWGQLDEFLDQFPGYLYQPYFDRVAQLRKENPDAYIKVSLGHFLFWRMAEIRGLQNFLIDMYENPEELKIVIDRLLDMYAMWAKHLKEAGADGLHGGDDIGTQRALFCRPEKFREIFNPAYERLGDILHSNGLDFWLHSCGNITEIIDDLIGAGVDVLHPIQVGTMDAEAIARKYGGKVCFHIGMDVQHLIPYETEDVIYREVKNRMKMFYRPEGGAIFGAGNALTSDIPIKNIIAYSHAMEDFALEVAINE